MSCDRYRTEIADAAAGGEPSPELEAHLEECEACRGELEARRRALTLADAELEELLAATPSPELPARIRRAVAADERPAWWPRRARPALAAAASLLLALGAMAAWRAASRSSVPESVQQTRLEPTPSAEPGLREPPSAPAPPPGSQTPRAALAEAAAGGRTLSEPAPAPADPPGSESPLAPSAGSREPEVLVPVGQEEALLRFAAELQSRTVTPDSVLVAELSAPLCEPRPLHRVEIEMLTLDSSPGPGL